MASAALHCIVPCAIATAVAGSAAAATAGSQTPSENRLAAEESELQTIRTTAGTNTDCGFRSTSSIAFCSRRSPTRQLGEVIRSAHSSRSRSHRSEARSTQWQGHE